MSIKVTSMSSNVDTVPSVVPASPDTCSNRTQTSEATESEVNSAYFGDEESDAELQADKRKKLLKHADRQLSSQMPDDPRTETSIQYFEFEREANGLDGYFDGSSDSEDDLGAGEDNSFNFDMCRIRPGGRHQGKPTSLVVSNVEKLQENSHCESEGNEISGNDIVIDSEAVDAEDVLCAVREEFSVGAPPLAQEDDFDEADN